MTTGGRWPRPRVGLTLSLPQAGRQVLGIDLNRSESRPGRRQLLLCFPTLKHSTRGIGGRSLHRGISIRPMSAMGQSRPSGRSLIIVMFRFAPKSGQIADIPECLLAHPSTHSRLTAAPLLYRRVVTLARVGEILAQQLDFYGGARAGLTCWNDIRKEMSSVVAPRLLAAGRDDRWPTN